ncbi:MAG: hypothetical protein J6I76_01440 [Oribacterium sp.]|nr:hypothetical protein [Oribacterium sp.]
MKFLRSDNHITSCGERPVDMNDRESEGTAIELSLPTSLSEKAKACWDYFDGTAFAFEYKGRLVVTDEGLYLTEHGDGSHEAPFGFPRWVVDSWEELEKILEETYDELKEDGCLPETEEILTPEERHIASLNTNGARIKAPDGTTEPVSMDFYHRAVAQCREGGYNAITCELELPGIEGEFMIAFWSDGHVDSGSTRRIIDCLASR